ncbi:MAG: hypothetical protein B6U78_00215 [Candidatus Aenigmarchaeota archaeon ex4484_224]|nr:MAG: hypothetical protein B6U78_00215 [Candidatus Aenigmarchaeota archaeon ex4484_224]
MLITILTFLLSLYFLSHGSKILTESVIKIDKILGFGEFVIGFIFLALVTSLPELSLSLYSILNENESLSIANILGSNILDILLIGGIILIISKKIKVEKRDIPLLSKMLFVSSIFPLLLLLKIETQAISSIFLLTFLFFVLISVKRKISFKIFQKLKTKKAKIEFVKNIVLVFIGTFLVVFSAKFLVESSIDLIKIFGLTNSFVGGFLMAFGTSIPELSLALASRKKSGLIFGNIVGSCLINITLVLGIVSFFILTINPYSIILPIIFSTFSSFLFYLLIKRKVLGKKEGIFMILIYLIYIILSFKI